MVLLKKWFILLPIVFFVLFIALGIWQLKRASYHKSLINIINEKKFLDYKNIDLITQLTKQQIDNLEFVKVKLKGKFVNQYYWFYDNQIHNTKSGYFLLRLFQIEQDNSYIIVNSGFYPKNYMNPDLPKFTQTKELSDIQGYLYKPVVRWVLKEQQFNYNIDHLVQILDVNKMTTDLKIKLYPLILNLDSKSSFSSSKRADVVSTAIDPNKNYGYAIQWFGFALILLIGGWLYARKNR